VSYTRAHARLTEIAQFKSQNEGQQVWTLSHDKHFQYLIIGFDRERNVRYVTAIACPDGPPIGYADVGNLAISPTPPAPAEKAIYASPGKPMTKKPTLNIWSSPKAKTRSLNQYAVKPLGLANEDDEK
jgi:hypothetical protein